MSIRRERNHDRVATKFSWRDHPVGKFAKILCYLVGQQAAEKSHGRVSAIPRSTLWAEVVTKRMPYLPAVWTEAAGNASEPRHFAPHDEENAHGQYCRSAVSDPVPGTSRP